MSGLNKETEVKIRSVLSSFIEIESAILFGSRAKGDYKTGSDIDLTFIGRNLTLQTVNAVHDALDELYLPYTFDLSIFEKIENPELKNHVTRVGKIFYQKGK